MTDTPQPHPGTDNQIRLNRLSHQWFTLDSDDYYCLRCDCNQYGITADYPCGQEPPRHPNQLPGPLPIGKIPYETDGTGVADPYYEDQGPEDGHVWGHTP